MEAKESLFECLEQVPDPRMARGVRHPFQAILRLTLLGPGLRSDHHGPHRPLRQDELAGSEGTLGVSQGPSTPRHHHLARGPGGGSRMSGCRRP